MLYPRKPFYAFRSFGKLYALGTETESESSSEHLYVCAATDGNASAAMLTSYRTDFAGEILTVSLSGLPAGGCRARVYLTDEGHENSLESEFALTGETADIHLRLDDEQVRLIEVEPV